MSLALRAVVALALMILFVALAIGAVIGLGWLGAVSFGLLEHIQGRGAIAVVLLALSCFGAAGIIVWSMFPRPDRFEPPGPEVREAEQPELFAEIQRIATATGERMPRHVYVMWAINAFVAQRGGIMGFGSRRVMGIGLPLVRALTVSELRAVLAHEMGHFYGGDTRLGPWIYKTRGAIARTVINLVRAGNAAQFSNVVTIVFIVVLAPFRWFGNGFMRVSQAISRAQELGADRVAARCAGAMPLAEGLKKTHAAAIAHKVYMGQEVVPMIDGGLLPPIGEGFSRFLGARPIRKVLGEALETELREGVADPYDSHPALRERLAALEHAESCTDAPDTRPAVALFAGIDQLERSLIASKVSGRLDPIAWEEVARHWVTKWRGEATKLAPHLAGVAIAALPAAPRDLQQLAARVAGPQFANNAGPENVRNWATGVLGAALTVALADAGFTIETPVGEPVLARRGELAIEPFVEVGELLDGEATRDAWCERWDERGLAQHALAGAAA